MKLIIPLIVLPVFLAAASDLSITDGELSAHDVAKVLGLQIRKFRISHPENTRLNLSVNVAMYHQTSVGQTTKLREHTMIGSGRAPEWAHTDVVVALHEQAITCETTVGRMRFPKDFARELFGDGVFLTHYTSEPTEFGTVIYERFPDPSNKNEKFFLAVSFSKADGGQ